MTFLYASIEYFLPAKTSWSQVVPPGGPVDASTVSGQSSSVGATPTPPTVLPPHPSTTPTPIQPQQQPASEHRFTYSDISVTSLRGLEPHISVSVPQVGDVRVRNQTKVTILPLDFQVLLLYLLLVHCIAGTEFGSPWGCQSCRYYMTHELWEESETECDWELTWTLLILTNIL